MKTESPELQDFDKMLEEARKLAATSSVYDKKKSKLTVVHNEISDLKHAIDKSLDTRHHDKN